MTSAASLPHHETKIRIPFPNEANPTLYIVGILAQKSSSPFDPSSPSSSSSPPPRRKLALITHGVLAHKDQAYHKLLAAQLPMDSFRFDFRANHETPGDWDMAKFENDIEDVECVLAHLYEKYGYQLDIFVGHSRGSLVGWKWFAENSPTYRQRVQSSEPPLWVSLGGRWRMDRIHDRDAVYQPEFDKQGYYTWNAKVAGKEVSVRITPAQVEEFAQYPISTLVSQFPADIDCLLIHGTADETVPCPDVGFYLNALTARADRVAGQTQLHLVEKGNHMFKGHYDEVAAIVTQWYRSRRHSEPSAASTEPAQMALEASQEEDVLERSWNESAQAKGKL